VQRAWVLPERRFRLEGFDLLAGVVAYAGHRGVAEKPRDATPPAVDSQRILNSSMMLAPGIRQGWFETPFPLGGGPSVRLEPLTCH